MRNLLKYISILFVILGIGLGSFSTPTFAVDQNFWTKTASHVLMTNDGTGLANADIHVRNCYIGTGTGTPCGGGGGGGGTVTSVGLALPTAVFNISGSPVTTSGTLTATFDTQNANLIFAGPATGAAATPTFRTLTTADLPGSGFSPFAVNNTSSIFSSNTFPITSSATDSFFVLDDAGAGANVSSSIMIGVASGQNATNASDSVFLGQQTGLGGTNANNSFFALSQAGSGATSAEFSNFIGAGAGLNATGANNSNFFGRNAGDGATNAIHAFFAGNNAGQNATGANNLICIGQECGQNASAAGHSVFLGTAAGNGATNAAFSNFFGNSAGLGATDASNSNFIGTSAGASATNALNSNFIGAGAGGSATNARNSIFIGTNAGQSDTVNNTVSGSSILIGSNTSTAGFQNSIAIGEGATNTAINEFLIDDSYTRYNFRGLPYIMPSVQATANQVLTATSVGSGVATLGWATVPTLDLETDGTPNGDQTLLNLVGGAGIILTDSGTGDVTIDSDLTFQVNGSPTPTQTLLNLVAGTGITITDSGAGDVTFDVTGGGGVTIYTGDGTISGSRNVDLAGNDLNFTDSASGDKDGLYIDAGGFISALGSPHGSGNTSLYVDNNTNTVVVEAGSLQIPAGATAGYVLTSDATGIASWQAAGSGSGTVTDFIFTDGSGFDGTVSTSTSTPTLALTTSLTTGSVPFIGASGALSQDNAQFFFDNTNDRLGLGTASPTAKLDLREAGTGLTAAWTGYSGTNSGSTFNTTAGVLTNTVASFVNTATRSAGANALTNIGLVASASGAQNNYAALFPLGNVGITQSSPLAKLHISTDSIGATQADTTGIILQNATAATSGLQQYSPTAVFRGSAWLTTTGAAHSLDYRIFNRPVGGTTAAKGGFVIQQSLNGAAYTDTFEVGQTVANQNDYNIKVNGSTLFALGGGVVQLYGSSSGFQFLNSAGTVQFGALDGNGRWALTPSNVTSTSGTVNAFSNVATFAPTSGTAIWNQLSFTPTINQTGGASGITRGIYINPTLTVAPDFRAFEASAGKMVMPAVTSSAGTLTLANAQEYIFTGTTSTWTLPALGVGTASAAVIYNIKNAGSGDITLNSSAGGNDIYDTSAVNTITIPAGAARRLVGNGTAWYVE